MPRSRARSSRQPGPRPVVITPRVLRRSPLPQPDEDADKEERLRAKLAGLFDEEAIDRHERVLSLSGAIRTMGRVDHGDAAGRRERRPC